MAPTFLKKCSGSAPASGRNLKPTKLILDWMQLPKNYSVRTRTEPAAVQAGVRLSVLLCPLSLWCWGFLFFLSWWLVWGCLSFSIAAPSDPDCLHCLKLPTVVSVLGGSRVHFFPSTSLRLSLKLLLLSILMLSLFVSFAFFALCSFHYLSFPTFFSLFFLHCRTHQQQQQKTTINKKKKLAFNLSWWHLEVESWRLNSEENSHILLLKTNSLYRYASSLLKKETELYKALSVLTTIWKRKKVCNDVLETAGMLGSQTLIILLPNITVLKCYFCCIDGHSSHIQP